VVDFLLDLHYVLITSITPSAIIVTPTLPWSLYPAPVDVEEPPVEVAAAVDVPVPLADVAAVVDVPVLFAGVAFAALLAAAKYPVSLLHSCQHVLNQRRPSRTHHLPRPLL
jgi:hypothetical protein